MSRPVAVILWLAVLMGWSPVVGWSAESSVAYDAHGRRDPFEALMTPTGELRTPRIGTAGGLLRVEGILWDPAQPLALINGSVYRVGDVVEEYHVIEIQTQAVVVESDTLGRLVIPVVSGGGAASDAP